LILCFLASAAAAQAPQAEARLEGVVDWSNYSASVTVNLDAAALGFQPPAGRDRALSLAQAALPGLLRADLFSVLVDSRSTIGQAAAQGTAPLYRFSALAEAAEPLRPRFSADMRSFSVDYRFSLLDLASALVMHSRAAEPPRPLSYSSTRTFSGIIISAIGRLPVHGERVADELRPCLFPRIWDEDLTQVLERNMVAPEAIRKWGMLGYAEEGMREVIDRRVGGDPLRITAKAIFGTNRTDIVISRRDALMILTDPGNRLLLTAGRVAVMLDRAERPLGREDP
jgi:hypothetical protein